MMTPDPVNPAMTTKIQNSFTNVPGLEINTRPWIVEYCRNSLMISILLYGSTSVDIE